MTRSALSRIARFLDRSSAWVFGSGAGIVAFVLFVALMTHLLLVLVAGEE